MYILTAPVPAELALVLKPYRQKYDSQAKVINAHVSIVPSFVFFGEVNTLLAHLAQLSETHAPIKASVVGWDVHPYQQNFQLRLPLMAGRSQFSAVREHALSGPLAYLAQPNRPYWPHVEFGQLANPADVALAKENLRQFEPTFTFRVMHLELQQRNSAAEPWQLCHKIPLEATVAGMHQLQTTAESLHQNQFTRK